MGATMKASSIVAAVLLLVGAPGLASTQTPPRQGMTDATMEHSVGSTPFYREGIFLGEEPTSELGTTDVPQRFAGFASLKGFSGLHRFYEVLWEPRW